MKIKVEELINGIQRYHGRLADYYFETKRKMHDTRVSALLDYLGRAEQFQEQNIMSLRQAAGKNVLEMIITIPDYPFNRILQGMKKEEEGGPPKNYDEVLRDALQRDVILKKACKLLTENVTDSGARSLFSNICRESERDIRNLFSYNNLFAS